MDGNPSDKSADAKAMDSYLTKVSTILGGTEAMRAATQYLPKFPEESGARYEFRRQNAKFTNIFQDIVENLAQRPFSNKVEMPEDKTKPELLDFQDDVDGRGNHLHVFAGDVFFYGIANAVDWILVDYTRGVPANASLAVEKAAGARPYWVRIPAPAMLAVYSDVVNGKEQITHARFFESEAKREGWGETINRDRVRVLTRDPLDGGGYGPARWEVWEKTEAQANAESKWMMMDEGPISIGEIPLVPFITGRRKGDTWQFTPPMRAAADLQIEHYQQESGLKHAKIMTAFPMLAGNGITPPMDEEGTPKPVPVGPHAVLFAPMSGDGKHGEWKFIEPSSESLKFLAEDIKETARELRELGRQPLTAQSGNLTVVTTAFAAQKGNAAIQAWALGLKDALENAMMFTAKWLKLADADPSVTVSTDFSLDMGDDKSFDQVLKMADGPDPMISREAAIHEAKRRGILDSDYDPDADLEAILAEAMRGEE